MSLLVSKPDSFMEIYKPDTYADEKTTVTAGIAVSCM